ncbi:MAG TPA: ion transporter [Candidatus Limnocylindrales bacterium]|jgi:voltage-gated potassium channel
MTTNAPRLREHGNAYNIFILVLTLFSLAVMVLLVLPLPKEVDDLLLVYDNVACLIFLADFADNLAGARPRRAYLIGARGWLDLLGSIPSLGLFQLTALFRLARLSRLTRIRRLLRGKSRKALIRDVVENRSQYATFITILSAGLVLSVASVLVLEFEVHAPDGNIKSGGDALWWGLVTITTVGYGDFFPVTPLGRATGFFVMIAGVGIIGALASILASLLVSSPSADTSEDVEDASRTAAIVRAGAGAVGNIGDAPAAAAEASSTAALHAKLDALLEDVARIRSEIAVRPPGSGSPG